MSARKSRPTLGDPVHPGMSERDVSVALGMSLRKIWEAKQIASIPEADFDRLVESDDPPTPGELVNMAQNRAGSKRRNKVCPHCGGRL